MLTRQQYKKLEQLLDILPRNAMVEVENDELIDLRVGDLNSS